MAIAAINAFANLSAIVPAAAGQLSRVATQSATATAGMGSDRAVSGTAAKGGIPAVSQRDDRQVDRFLRAAVDGDVGSLQRMMAEGVAVNAANAHGYTALNYAAGGGHLEAVQILLAAGANVHAVCEPKGRTVLMQAAGRGGADAVKALLAAKPRLEDRDRDGRTAMMVAALAGDKDAVFALFEAGADPHATDNSGAKASELAAELGHHWVASLLRGAEKARRPQS